MPISPNVLMRLKHPDPAVRRQAVIEAGRSGDLAVMPALREMFQNDADPALRDLARKAGQYLREHAADAGAGTGANALPDDRGSRSSDPRGRSHPNTPPASPLPPPSKSKSSRSEAGSALGEAALSSASPFMPPFDEPDLDALTGAPLRRPPPLPARADEPDDPQMEQVIRAASTGYIPPDNLYTEAETPAESEEAAAAPAYSGPVRGRKYTVSKENVEKGKYFTEQALSQNATGQNDKAMKSLANGLVANPNLVNDQYYMNVAAGVTGLEGDGAIQMIVNTQQRKTFVKAQEQQRKTNRVRQQKETAQADNWGSILFELALYALVIFGASIILFVIAQQSVRSAFGDDLSTSTLRQAGIARDNIASVQAFTQVGLGALLLFALINAALQSLSILLQGVFIHGGARLLSRIGTYAHLMTLMLRAYNRWLPVLFSIVGASIYLTVITAGSPLVACLAIILVIASGYTTLKIINAIGAAYSGGAGMGCLLLLIAGLLQAVLTGGVGLLFGTAAANIVGGLLGIPT